MITVDEKLRGKMGLINQGKQLKKLLRVKNKNDNFPCLKTPLYNKMTKYERFKNLLLIKYQSKGGLNP